MLCDVFIRLKIHTIDYPEYPNAVCQHQTSYFDEVIICNYATKLHDADIGYEIYTCEINY